MIAASPGEILELIRSGRVRTRRELQELTGLSRSTLVLRLNRLISSGYVRESARQVGSAGRPAAVLSFDEADKLVLCADLGATHARFALLDAGGRSLAETTQELLIQSGPGVVLDVVVRRFRELLRRADRSLELVAGIGVGVPGPVDFRTGRPAQPPIMPGWHDYPVASALSEALGPPAFVDNDANLMGLAEMRSGYPDVASLLFVKVGTGIGAGVILAGSPERGVSGGAGDIGHIRLANPSSLARCACGAVGCLAAHASGAALARRLSTRTSRDVVRLVQSGDARATALVGEAGRLLGEVLATAVALLNPAVLVIGGDLAGAGEPLLAGVRETLYERTVSLRTRDLTVLSSRLGDRAGVDGARHLVVDQVFSARAVDADLGVEGS
jgi:predicted NBD/HSP70 family sugar kinase